MNVSYLLVTTAWLAGAEPTPAFQAGNAAMITPVHHRQGGSDACCDDWRGRLRERAGGLFRRDRCCDPCPTPCPKQDNCCQTRSHGHRDNCCQTNDNCCDRPRLLDRLKGLFRRDRGGCCDPCANGAVGGGGKAEPIPPPKDKKMPKGNNEPSQLLNPGVPPIPFNTPALQTPPLAPQNPGNLDRRDRDF